MATFEALFRGRRLDEGRRSILTILDVDTLACEAVFVTACLIEAPNWTPDGRQLIFNAGGQIWRIPVEGGEPALIDTAPVEDLNNDHVLSPDGARIYLSSNDSHLYVVGSEGGRPVRVSNVHATPWRHYLHGVSPDETELAYVAIEGEGANARRNIFAIPAAGGPDRRLTDFDRPSDGPEYTPDGRWIYFNSEVNAAADGHAQIHRMRRDGTGVEQLTFDERVNWFPHVSPDSSTVAYLSYPPGTLGHPADRDVIIRALAPQGGAVRDLVAFRGGQGSLNVNSWSPDSRRLAFVAYPSAG
jgi:Tol biopolymer transport system component